MLRKIFVALAIIFGAFASSGVANAQQLDWIITNSTPFTIHIKFASSNRNNWWPGGNQGWDLYPGQTTTFNLGCHYGEQIAFSGVARQNTRITWGFGNNLSNGCTQCTAICGAGGISQNLTYRGY